MPRVLRPDRTDRSDREGGLTRPEPAGARPPTAICCRGRPGPLAGRPDRALAAPGPIPAIPSLAESNRPPPSPAFTSQSQILPTVLAPTVPSVPSDPPGAPPVRSRFASSLQDKVSSRTRLKDCLVPDCKQVPRCSNPYNRFRFPHRTRPSSGRSERARCAASCNAACRKSDQARGLPGKPPSPCTQLRPSRP